MADKNNSARGQGQNSSGNQAVKSIAPGPNADELSGRCEVKGSPIQGLGLFAVTSFQQGERVIEYLGERITKRRAAKLCEEGNVFVFCLTDDHDLNGDVPWNPARHANHSCDPNCEAELVEERIWLNALRPIAAGEEITFDYGYDLVDYRDHICRCGASNCPGYIVAAGLRGTLKPRG